LRRAIAHGDAVATQEALGQQKLERIFHSLAEDDGSEISDTNIEGTMTLRRKMIEREEASQYLRNGRIVPLHEEQRLREEQPDVSGRRNLASGVIMKEEKSRGVPVQS
jgi:hypothetical protein